MVKVNKQKILDEYNQAMHGAHNADEGDKGTLHGIELTLNYAGITINGINGKNDNPIYDF